MEDNKNLTRIPQAFTFDHNVLRRTYGEEESLIKDIFVYCLNKSINLFLEEITFDLKEFCDALGYSIDEMQRTLPQFVDCPDNEKPIEGGHCFDGVFEYALYKGFVKPIVFDTKRVKSEGFELQKLDLFSKIRADYKKTGRREKRTYTIELDYRLRKWQLDRFFYIDLLLYQKIYITRSRKSTGGLRNLYVYFGRIVSQIEYKKEKGKEPSYILTVDQAAEIMGLNIVRNDHRKRRVKEYLNMLQSFLGEKHFTYEFFKGKWQNYKYSIKFTLTDAIINHYDDPYKNSLFNDLNEVIYKQLYRKDQKGYRYLGEWKKELSLEQVNKATKSFFNIKAENNSDAREQFKIIFFKHYKTEYDNQFGEIT